MHNPQEYKISLPIFVGGRQRTLKSGELTKPTKKHWLNLNNYRNWHYQTLNSTKIQFKNQVKDQIDSLPNISDMWKEVSLEYVIHYGSKRVYDGANIYSVVDKYFCDALVELGKLDDDNHLILKSSSWSIGDIDKENPRADVIIRPYDP